MEESNPKKKIARGGRRRRTGLKRQRQPATQTTQNRPNLTPTWVSDDDQAVEPPLEDTFAQLVNELPLRHFELPKLDSSLFDIISDRIKQKLPTIEAIKFNATSSLLAELGDQAAQYDKVLASVTLLSNIDLTSQQEPLNNCQKLIAQFASLIRYKKIYRLKPEHLALVAELKKELNFYYNQHAPLVDFIASLKTKPSPSWWHQILHPFTNWIQFHQSKKKFSDIQEKLVYHQKMHKEQLFVVQEALFMMDKVVYGIETYQHVFGQISIGKMMEKNIDRVSYALIDTCPMQGILKCYIEYYQKASLEGQGKLLYLIESLMRHDTQHHLLDCDGESQIIDMLLEHIKTCILDMEVMDKEEEEVQKTHLEKLQLIVELKQELKEKTISEQAQFIDDLEHEIYTVDDLIKIMKSLSQDYHNHVRTLRHIILFTKSLILHLPESALSHPNHRELTLLIRDFIHQVSVSKNMALRQMLEELLDKNIHTKIYDLPEWARPEEIVVDELQPMTKKEMAFNKQLELVAKGKLNKKQYNAFMINTCEAIRDHCKYLYQKIDLCELKKATWSGQITHLQSQGLLYSEFPNLSQLIQFELFMQNYIADVVLFELTPNKKPRTSLKQVYRLLRFFDSLRLYARKKEYIQVKILVEKGLNHPAFEYFPVFKNDILDTEYFVLEELKTTQLPPFSALTERLTNLHDSCLGSFSYIVIGDLFSKLQNLKYHLKKEKKPRLFIYDCMLKRMATKVLEINPTLTIESLTQAEHTQIYLDVAGSLLMTLDEIKDTKFPDISKRCERAVFFQLPLHLVDKFEDSPKPLIKPLFNQLIKRVYKTEQMPTLRLILNIAENITKNNLINPKTDLVPCTAQLIKAWYDRVKRVITAQTLDNDQLKTLANELSITHELMPAELSKLKGSQEIIQLLKFIHSDSIDIQKVQIGPAYSQAYLKTLESYLSGTQQEQVKLPSKWDKDNIKGSEDRIILQDIEEETHPDEIGFAETWNIFKQISSNIIQGPPFSYQNLKDTFIKAFPWAIEKEEEFGKQPLIDNMLHISPKLALDIQKTVMELVFISIDTIGKLAGPYGEYVLFNLDKIDAIITSLSTVTQALDNPAQLLTDSQALTFIQLLDTKIDAIKETNELLFDKLQNNIPMREDEKFAANPEVNTLMSLNEKEAHFHVKQIAPEFNDPSILPPAVGEQFEELTLETDLEPEILDEWEALAAEVSNFFDDDDSLLDWSD